jgi:hypothetical protein
MSVPDYLGAFFAEPGDKVDYGVKGMKWGVRRSLTKMDPSARAGYLEGKEKKLTSRAADPKLLNRTVNRGAREFKKDVKAINKELKERGVNLKKDRTAQLEYQTKLTAAAEASMDRAASKVYGKSKTGAYEVKIVLDGGKPSAKVYFKTNPKNIKALNKIEKADRKREAKSVKHADISPDDEFVELPLTLDDEGYVIDIGEVEHSGDIPDYLAAAFVTEGDKVDYGVKGMKWGVRRSSSQLKSAAKSRGESKKTESKPEEKKTTSSSSSSTSGQVQPPSVETSAQRYARLAETAKQGGASSLSDTDLKFFNARTDAITKINKMYEEKPGWLAETSKKVLLNTAEQTMQQVSNGVAKKYISGPILEGMGIKQGKDKKDKS